MTTATAGAPLTGHAHTISMFTGVTDPALLAEIERKMRGLYPDLTLSPRDFQQLACDMAGSTPGARFPAGSLARWTPAASSTRRPRPGAKVQPGDVVIVQADKGLRVNVVAIGGDPSDGGDGYLRVMRNTLTHHDPTSVLKLLGQARDA